MVGIFLKKISSGLSAWWTWDRQFFLFTGTPCLPKSIRLNKHYALSFLSDPGPIIVCKRMSEYAEYADWSKQSMPGSVVPLTMFSTLLDTILALFSGWRSPVDLAIWKEAQRRVALEEAWALQRRAMEREGQGGEQESSQGGIEEEGEQRRQEGLERLVPRWLTLSLDRSMKIGRSLVCGNIEGTLSERRLKDIDREVLNQNRQTKS